MCQYFPLQHAGNSLSELEEGKGHYLCNLRLKPIVQRFKLPEPEEGAAAGSAEGTLQPTGDSEGPSSAAAEQVPPGGSVGQGTVGVAAPAPAGYAPVMTTSGVQAQTSAGVPPASGAAAGSVTPLV